MSKTASWRTGSRTQAARHAHGETCCSVLITSYVQCGPNLRQSIETWTFEPFISLQDMRAEAEQQIYEKLNMKIEEFLDLGKDRLLSDKVAIVVIL